MYTLTQFLLAIIKFQQLLKETLGVVAETKGKKRFHNARVFIL